MSFVRAFKTTIFETKKYLQMNIELILAIVGAIFGAGGIGTGLFYFKQNKQLKDTEVKSSQYQSETVFIDNAVKATDFFKDALEFEKKRLDEVEAYHNEKYERVIEIVNLYKAQVNEYKDDSEFNRKQLRTLSTKVRDLEKKINENKHLICHNTHCELRKTEM